MLEQGGGVDGHKERAGSGVMGGRGFLFLRETTKCKAQSIPQTELIASRKRDRVFGKLQGSLLRSGSSLCLERFLATLKCCKFPPLLHPNTDNTTLARVPSDIKK